MKITNEYKVSKSEEHLFLCPYFLSRIERLKKVFLAVTYVVMFVSTIMVFLDILDYGWFFISLIPLTLAILVHIVWHTNYRVIHDSFENFGYTQKTVITEKDITVRGRKTITYSWDEITWVEDNQYYVIFLTRRNVPIPIKIKALEKKDYEELIEFLDNNFFSNDVNPVTDGQTNEGVSDTETDNTKEKGGKNADDDD